MLGDNQSTSLHGCPARPDIVIVKISNGGPDTVINRQQLESCSDTFRNMILVHPRLNITDASRRTFAMFLVWLRSPNLMTQSTSLAAYIEVDQDIPSTVRSSGVNESTWQYLDLAELYIFARRYDITAFQNDILTVLVHQRNATGKFIDARAVHAVYDALPSGKCGFLRFAANDLRGRRPLPTDLAFYPAGLCTDDRVRTPEDIVRDVLRPWNWDGPVGISPQHACYLYHSHTNLRDASICQARLGEIADRDRV